MSKLEAEISSIHGNWAEFSMVCKIPVPGENPNTLAEQNSLFGILTKM